MSTNESVEFQLGSSLIEISEGEKMLGIKIDCKFDFGEHVKSFCSKANNKLRGLAKILRTMSVEKNECFSTHSLITALLYGCCTAVGITISLQIFMSDILG